MNSAMITTVAQTLADELGDSYTVRTYSDEIVVTLTDTTGPYINIDQPYADVDEFSVELAPLTDDPSKHIDDIPFDEDEEGWLDELVDRLADTVALHAGVTP